MKTLSLLMLILTMMGVPRADWVESEQRMMTGSCDHGVDSAVHVAVTAAAVVVEVEVVTWIVAAVVVVTSVVQQPAFSSS